MAGGYDRTPIGGSNAPTLDNHSGYSGLIPFSPKFGPQPKYSGGIFQSYSPDLFVVPFKALQR